MAHENPPTPADRKGERVREKERLHNCYLHQKVSVCLRPLLQCRQPLVLLLRLLLAGAVFCFWAALSAFRRVSCSRAGNVVSNSFGRDSDETQKGGKANMSRFYRRDVRHFLWFLLLCFGHEIRVVFCRFTSVTKAYHFCLAGLLATKCCRKRKKLKTQKGRWRLGGVPFASLFPGVFQGRQGRQPFYRSFTYEKWGWCSITMWIYWVNQDSRD